MSTAFTHASPPGLLKEAVRSGTIAAVIMMPVGLLFKALGLRVGHDGPKLGEFIFGSQPEPRIEALLLVQLLIIGWLSAIPLLLFWKRTSPRPVHLSDGLLYGAFYDATIDAVALPSISGDALAGQLGGSYVCPGLAVHPAFGLSIAVTARAFGWARPIAIQALT